MIKKMNSLLFGEMELQKFPTCQGDDAKLSFSIAISII